MSVHRVKLGLAALLVAEFALFVLLARAIGLLATLLLMVLISLTGIALLKSVGRRTVEHVRGALAAGRIGEPEINVAGFFTMLAGILLIVPGFLTDLVALPLLLPPVQRRLRAALGRVLYRRRARQEGVVDLEPGEWSSAKEEVQSLSPGTRCVSHTGDHGDRR
jgi:UPF0716 protein FxsA